MSSITGRANFLLTTSTGGGIQMGVKKATISRLYFCVVVTLPLPEIPITHLLSVQ
ncbi:Uncharacterised protein [Salmonella enterica subsp. indica]|uniref:Uncharacterized protein n=3 Tax=Salmonella enterica TaxID=28901 RepID=A0A379XTJ0_SALER|nr:Uncharacterised protein [Salmonella enterica subsp. indica]